MRRLAFMSVAAAIALAACSHAVAPPIVPSASTNRVLPFANFAASSFKVLWNFDDTGGASVNPSAGLVDVNGTLYGTTHGGGSTKCAGGCGTVYSMSHAGAENGIYNFGSYKGDGIYPASLLVNIGGTFYGITRKGGSSTACPMGCGTFFSLTKAGKETVIYSFGSYRGDGTNPQSGLISAGGKLYGTTETGGASNHGTVYSITTAGVETVFYSFGSYRGDGLYPLAELFELNGTLYGTTEKGGANNGGSVFRVTPNGTEVTLHSFGGGVDGKYPLSRLTFAQGSLYGTTSAGGTHGLGAVFIMDTNGIEGLLHSFNQRGGDGTEPVGPLTVVPGPFVGFYGTTAHGGAHNFGTIFSLAGSGAETVVHSFDGHDGAYPIAHLLRLGGTFYGITPNGGIGSCAPGCGTAFTFKP